MRLFKVTASQVHTRRRRADALLGDAAAPFPYESANGG